MYKNISSGAFKLLGRIKSIIGEFSFFVHLNLSLFLLRVSVIGANKVIIIISATERAFFFSLLLPRAPFSLLCDDAEEIRAKNFQFF